MVIALILAASLGATVVRCVDARGGVRFQDKPCAQGEQAREIDLRDEPVRAPPEPEHKIELRGRPDEQRTRFPQDLQSAPAEARSWRCAAENGEVFYQHGGCPATIYILQRQPFAYAGSAQFPVKAISVPRREACAAITAKAAGDRFGSDRDQRDKDLCR